MQCEKITKITNLIEEFHGKMHSFLNRFFAPVLLFLMRLLVAGIFLRSGLTKFSNIDSAIMLFEYEYQLPIISPVLAAYLATFFEIFCSILLIFGFATRLAAIPLLIMTLVIQFLVIAHPQHVYWFFSLATILTFGPGYLSVDRALKPIMNKFCKK